MTSTIAEWLMNRASIEACLAAINSLNAITGAFDHAGAGGYLSNMLAATQTLRGTVTRIQTIRRTSFIPGLCLAGLLVKVYPGAVDRRRLQKSDRPVSRRHLPVAHLYSI